MQRSLTRRRIYTRHLRPILKNYELYIFVVPALIYLFIYCYLPMYGIQIAFKDYRVGKGILGSEWVGLKHFSKFFFQFLNF